MARALYPIPKNELVAKLGYDCDKPHAVPVQLTRLVIVVVASVEVPVKLIMPITAKFVVVTLVPVALVKVIGNAYVEPNADDDFDWFKLRRQIETLGFYEEDEDAQLIRGLFPQLRF